MHSFKLNPGATNLLSRKKRADNMFGADPTIVLGKRGFEQVCWTKSLYEGINMLDLHYCRSVEASVCWEMSRTDRSSTDSTRSGGDVFYGYC